MAQEGFKQVALSPTKPNTRESATGSSVDAYATVLTPVAGSTVEWIIRIEMAAVVIDFQDFADNWDGIDLPLDIGVHVIETNAKAMRIKSRVSGVHGDYFVVAQSYV
jgi:aryl-phospho-beta-D-glucosidase BglC (GH1 family)